MQTRTGWMARVAVLALMGALGACASGVARLGAGPDAGITVTDAALGSGLEAQLNSRAEARMAAALGTALMSSQALASASWGEARSGLGDLKGAVRVGPPFLRGLQTASGAVLEAPLDLNTDFGLEPLREAKVTTVNANVRLGPDTDYPRVATLPKGTPVTAHAKVDKADWVLIALAGADAPTEERLLGYLYRPLLAEPPKARESEPEGEGEGYRLVGGETFARRDGSEAFDLDLALAGGAAERPAVCRSFEQKVAATDGTSHVWSGTACRIGPQRWRVIDNPVGFGS